MSDSKIKHINSTLIYEELAPIDIKLFPKIKLIFIITKFDASDVIFVTTTNDVFGFGTNKFGRIGLGHNNAVSEPIIIPELCAKDVVNVEYGHYVMIALTQSMDVFTAGYDYNGLLGNGQNTGLYRKPQKLNDDLIVSIACCYARTYLLCGSQNIYWFGYQRNSTNQTITKQTPTLVNMGEAKIRSISCGSVHIIALSVTGKVYAWGNNGNGQLGIGNTITNESPQLIQISDNKLVKSISCGSNHSLLLTTDGHIYAFGYNGFGQLGTGDIGDQMTPKLIELDYKLIEIFAFNNISMALTENNITIVFGEIGNNKITKPLETKNHSFQEAINHFCKKKFTYKPISGKEVFIRQKNNRIVKTISNAFNDKTYSDLTFKLKLKGSEDKSDYIYVHKWFVAKASEYFERMFSNNWLENKSNEIEITGYSYEAFYQYIQCLYTDSIETQDIQLLIELLSITNEYLDQEMKDKCVQNIKPLINLQNVCLFFSNSRRNDSKELEEFCFKYMSEHIKSITETDDFDRMDSNDINYFMKQLSRRLVFYEFD